MIVYLTNKALSSNGIRVAKITNAKLNLNSRIEVLYIHKGEGDWGDWIEKHHCHKTFEDAVKYAEFLRFQRISILTKQLDRLKKKTFKRPDIVVAVQMARQEKS